MKEGKAGALLGVCVEICITHHKCGVCVWCVYNEKSCSLSFFQFKLHICITSAGLDHWWNLPEESLRGQGPRAMRRACLHMTQPPVWKLMKSREGRGEAENERE